MTEEGKTDEKPVDLDALEVEIANVTTYLPTLTERKMLRALAELRATREQLAELEQSLEALHVPAQTLWPSLADTSAKKPARRSTSRARKTRRE